MSLQTHRARSARRAATLVVLAGTTLVALATGCSDDAADGSAGASPSEVVVTAGDFHFDAVPDAVPVGTPFRLENTSGTELHELVAVRLPDGETRPVGEIVAEDVGSLFAGPPAMVLLTPPSSDEQVVAVGDGTLTEPGRYALVCMIPTGADPAEYMAAAATSDGPPQVAGGPPHVAHGMWTEIRVG